MQYRKHAKGLLYKRSLSFLAQGVMLATISAALLQYATVSNPYLRRVSFNGTLVVVYVILAAYAAGFLMIAFGADKLRRIEEV